VRPLAKTFVTAAVLAAVSLTASGCDTSPYAAVANAHTIKETTLNAELAAWAGNKQYVNAFDSANGSSGLNVAGFAPGTYNSGWVASILDNAVVAGLIHQHLRALHEALDQPMMQAARAISEISQIGWSSFPPAFRNTLTTRLAEDANLTPTSVDSTTLQRVYQQYKPYFFSQVCLLEAAAFSLEQAQRLSTGGYPGGSQVCYSQTQFENQPADFSQAVMKLGVYQVSQPIKTRYGYQVVEVVSRDVFGFTPQLQRVISVAIVNAQGSPNPAVDGLLVSAKVKVNPQYGTWSQGQITPPKTPGSSQ
jgi:hypothetical protein